MKQRRLKKIFAENVFDEVKMKKYLPKKTYRAIANARKTNGQIERKHLEIFAQTLKKWAIKKGVTRFTHWFQPLNNYTAEKRDNIFSLDKENKAIEKFRGKELSQGEGDASSFPNGGLRQTFEARGTTKWDATSYAFIKDGCLCIPTTFYGYDSVNLDKKTPLNKSCAALSKNALKVLNLLGYRFTSVDSVVGAEQEYFLIDKSLFDKRDDLAFCGRTLLGARPAKGQEFCDHYYRPIPRKIADFMKDVDDELWKLGVIVKTEHNEVAPSQFELAPCYSPTNIACDQNQIIMETLKKTAEKHDLACLLHEKPFEGVNGSGKHNNWSLLADSRENLLEIGDTPKDNARFMLFLAAVIKAVDDYSDLLIASVCYFGNDLRLGRAEAPPKILSVFLGSLKNAVEAAESDSWRAGEDALPKTNETTDRNRTSPFAYTGNKFEFRMVGSSATIADVNTVLNTAVAESLRQFSAELEKSPDVWKTVKEIAVKTFREHRRIVFDGDNYSPNWLKEAQNRGLSNLTTAEAYEKLTEDKNVELFETHGVLSKSELGARKQILQETYCNTARLESSVSVETVVRRLVPAAERYVKRLVEIAKNKRDLGMENGYETAKAEKITQLLEKCLKNADELQNELASANVIDDVSEKTAYYELRVLNKAEDLRGVADELELLCPKDAWPLPSYDELLY